MPRTEGRSAILSEVVLRRLSRIALAGLASCSLLTPLDGLSGGDGATTSDGSTDGTTPLEGGLDGGGDRLSPPPDGGALCASLSPPPRLCVDFASEIVFSTGAPTATSFQASDTKNAPDGIIDRTTFDSPSASARFVLSAPMTHSFLERTFPGPPPAHVEFSMAMRVDPSSDDDELDLMEIRFGGDAGLFLKRSAGGAMSIWNYAAGKPFRTLSIDGAMPQSRFVTYAWVIELGAAPTLTMTIDGKNAIMNASLLTFSGATDMSFVAGCTDYFPSAATSIWVDDVVVRF